MKVFKSNKILFYVVGILPYHRIKKPYDEIVKAISFVVHSILCVSAVLFSAAYIYGHFTDFSQLPDIILNFVVMFAITATIGAYGSVAINAEKVKLLNNELQQIVTKGNAK